MCVTPVFILPNFKRQSFDLKIQKLCVDYVCHLGDFIPAPELPYSD